MVTEECLETGECSPDDLGNASPQDVEQTNLDDSERGQRGETERESPAFDDGVTVEQTDENEEENPLAEDDDLEVAEDDQRLMSKTMISMHRLNRALNDSEYKPLATVISHLMVSYPQLTKLGTS